MDDFMFPSIITTQPSSYHLIKDEISFAGACVPPTVSLADVKAIIMAHPHYPNLVAAYAECHKLGAPPKVAARLSTITRDLETRSGGGRSFPTADPELDQFMEAYYDILIKYKEELSRPFKEAADFLRKAESQLSSITDLSSMSFHFSTEDIVKKHDKISTDVGNFLHLLESAKQDDFMFPSIITTQPSSSHLIKDEISFVGACVPPTVSPVDVKARIMAHPHNPNLIAAYAKCHKLGAPPEVAARLSTVTRDLETRSGGGRSFPTADPELDQFMEAYYDILFKYKEELSRPFEEAADFLRKAESQLSSITDLSSMSFHFSTEYMKKELERLRENNPKIQAVTFASCQA
ncbi:hypothetical protein IEQ34_007579 [Dendrobium chrysotoxum]|uniref:Uncharacterized protein n=1 Tax=Dendrobium chrysotoxum TaxID=161865 RepID=A0AAV7H3W0_DENCH|nr:hypothetical protein IEQ34_007579 [Dendrobium chrysotoxum]